MIMTTDLVEQWGSAMRFDGAAALTVRCRTRALRHLRREHGDLSAITREDLVAFLGRYENPSTRSTILSYIRCFYAWATIEEYLAENPTERMRKIKIPRAVPRPAPLNDIKRALGVASSRTRIWMLLMIYCGLRCCEVAPARREHLDLHGDGTWHLLIPRSKGGHRQFVPIPAWLAAEFRDAEPWDVCAQTVQFRVRLAFKEAGSPCTPHQLRHYFGTSALQVAHGDLRKVQELMRHQSPATTARYTQVSSSALSAVSESLPRVA